MGDFQVQVLSRAYEVEVGQFVLLPVLIDLLLQLVYLDGRLLLLCVLLLQNLQNLLVVESQIASLKFLIFEIHEGIVEKDLISFQLCVGRRDEFRQRRLVGAHLLLLLPEILYPF